MYLNEFAADFPEMYWMIDRDVDNALRSNQIHGELTLREWDNLVDGLVKKYEQQGFHNYDMNNITAQQYNDRYGDRDWRRDDFRDDGFRDDRFRDRHRGFRGRRFDFDVRDIVRLAFLRRLFNRNW